MSGEIRGKDIMSALDVGKKWTRQIKAEEKRPHARMQRSSIWASSRTSLKEICFENMEDAYMKASGNGELPTHWRMVFYVMRPIVEAHPESDRPLLDTTFKNIIEEYLDEYAPDWDILRGARGVFKEPHRAAADSGLALSTMNVRNYLSAAQPSATIGLVPTRFPTHGSANRIAAILICEKEGFDELLSAARVPARFDLALLSTKGISAIAARDLARELDAPCFTLHDMDKNGFVMSAGFPFATDLGIRAEDIEDWELEPEPQYHKNPRKTYANLVRKGATPKEAEFISEGQRVELNMFTGDQLIRYVENKLREHGVEKVMPDKATLADAWERAHVAFRMNELIKGTWPGRRPVEVDLHADIPPVPDDLEDQIRELWDQDYDNEALPWDGALLSLVTHGNEDGEE